MSVLLPHVADVTISHVVEVDEELAGVAGAVFAFGGLAHGEAHQAYGAAFDVGFVYQVVGVAEQGGMVELPWHAR